MSYDIDSPEFKRYLAWESDQILIEKLKEEIEQTKKFWYEHLEDVNKLHYLRVEQLKHALIIRGCYRDGFCDFAGGTRRIHTQMIENICDLQGVRNDIGRLICNISTAIAH